MTFEAPRRLLLARPPDRDPSVLAGCQQPAVGHDRDRIHRPLVKTHHLLGGVADERPADGRSIKPPGQRFLPVGADGERPYGAAMAPQLGMPDGPAEHEKERAKERIKADSMDLHCAALSS